MPANTVVNTSATDWDMDAYILRPVLSQAGTNKTFPYATCESITYSVGPEPGVALCRIPLRDVDDAAPAVAAVGTSPAAGIKILGSGYITITDIIGEVKGFHGLITKISHEFGPKADHANVRLEDARWLLKRLPIMGRWERSDTVGTTTATYRQGWPAWPNQFSQPNAVFSPQDNVFTFCKPRMGLNADETPPSPSARNSTKATWWTDATFIEYLRFTVSFTPSVVGASNPPYVTTPAGVNWPIGIAALLESETSPCKPINYDGKNLADTLSELARHAGPYDLAMDFNGDTPALTIIRTKYLYGESALSLNRADADNAITDPSVIIAGELAEDAEQFYSKVTVAGALTFVERRVSSVTAAGLIPAWSTETSGSGVAFVNTRLASGDTLSGAMAKAFSKFPDWYGAWRLNPDFDFMSGISSLAGFDFAKVVRPVADRLLTSYIAGSNVADADPSDRAQWRRPILVEYRVLDTDNFILASEGDGLQIDNNGVLRMYGLRNIRLDAPSDASQAYSVTTNTPLTAGLDEISGNQLRITLGIPCDHRVWKTFRHNSTWDKDNPTVDQGIQFPSDTYDEDRVEPGVAGGYAYMIGGDQDTLGDGTFRQELRISGWPIPESVAASNEFSDGVIWEDTGALYTAAAKQASKLMRLRRGGTLVIPRLSAAYGIGQVFASLGYNGGTYPIRAVVTKITWHNSEGSQRTVLELGG